MTLPLMVDAITKLVVNIESSSMQNGLTANIMQLLSAIGVQDMTTLLSSVEVRAAPRVCWCAEASAEVQILIAEGIFKSKTAFESILEHS